MKTLLVCSLSVLLLAGCNANQSGASKKSADAIYINGAIYTVDAQSSWAEAMAVADGKIAAVGKTADISAMKGDTTKVVDLQGGMVMPGIEDLHGHPMLAGTAQFFECSFPFTSTMDQILDKLRACAAKTPKGQWIRGGQWGNELLTSKTVPSRAVLDAVTSDHPIFLVDSTLHDAWMNSKALATLGIDRATPNPTGGVIDHDAAGQPTGIIHDEATFQTMHKLPAYTPAQYEQALQWAMGQMNAVGVTTLKDANVDGYAMRAYAALDRAGKLTMKVGTALSWKSSWGEDHDKEIENIKNRGQYKTAHVDTDFAKIFLDGIPPTRTAGMLVAYLPDKKHGANFMGPMAYTPEQLKEDVIALDKQGLTVKVHATGDRSVRVALDAFEAAHKANGTNLAHEIAHAELVSPEDIPRFKALNAVAEMCPILWYRSSLVDVMAAVVGKERAMHFWPTKSLVDAGALVTYGSDWPSVVPNPSPWRGIESLVTRRDPDTNQGDQLWPEQAIDLPTAVKIFTRNGAVAAKQGDKTGSLEVGKAADFILIDRNIFKIPIEQVSETTVLSTVIDGKEVYKK